MCVYTYINDLEELECILDQLVFEEEEPIFTDENTLDLIETALHLMDEYMSDNPTLISEPDFHDILLDEIQKLFYVQLEEHILNAYDDSLEEDLEELIEIAFDLFSTLFSVERSLPKEHSDEESDSDEDTHTEPHAETYEPDKEKHIVIESKINRLRNIPQPVQRTEEWYQFRHNLITASNAYKAFESQSMVNQLIYEKCQPLKQMHNTDLSIVSLVNTETTLHWGQKYEPLSVMFYENMYHTKVEDFGCIRHSLYHFIGASPDGIIVDKTSDRYGRMLEIKNIVNREINGNPKKEYWIQMQLQMEVCDLDDCDFLETKFIEYPDSNSYYEDIDVPTNMKGIIIHFHTKEGKPHYVYKPFHITDNHDISLWEETTIEEMEKETDKGYVFLKTIYWKLEKWSCVFVKRNREWFQNNISQLQQVWQTIEHERVHGYEHRAPKKKVKREKESTFTNESAKCLLSFSQIHKNQ
jgi:putative phage-type endonuclease